MGRSLIGGAVRPRLGITLLERPATTQATLSYHRCMIKFTLQHSLPHGLAARRYPIPLRTRSADSHHDRHFAAHPVETAKKPPRKKEPGKPSLSICFCFGPTGSGRSILTEMISSACPGSMAVDCDLLVPAAPTPQERTLENNAEERNDVTFGRIWHAILQGCVPVVSMDERVLYNTMTRHIRDVGKMLQQRFPGYTPNIIMVVGQQGETSCVHLLALGKGEVIISDTTEHAEELVIAARSESGTRKDMGTLYAAQISKNSKEDMVVVQKLLSQAAHSFVAYSDCKHDPWTARDILPVTA